MDWSTSFHEVVSDFLQPIHIFSRIFCVHLSFLMKELTISVPSNSICDLLPFLWRVIAQSKDSSVYHSAEDVD